MSDEGNTYKVAFRFGSSFWVVVFLMLAVTGNCSCFSLDRDYLGEYVGGVR